MKLFHSHWSRKGKDYMDAMGKGICKASAEQCQELISVDKIYDLRNKKCKITI